MRISFDVHKNCYKWVLPKSKIHSYGDGQNVVVYVDDHDIEMAEQERYNARVDDARLSIKESEVF